VHATFAESSEADAGTIFHPGGNFGINTFLSQHATFAFALGAGIGNHRTSALAGGTSARDAEKPLLIADLSLPIARTAGDWSLTRRCARTVAVLTSFVAADGNCLFRAEDCFFKLQIDVFAQVGAALSAAAALASTAAEEIAKSEKVSEDVAEVLE